MYFFCPKTMLIIGKEDYEELKDCLSETFEEIEKIKSEGIKIDGEHFDVEWWVAKIKIQSNFSFGLQR